MEKEISETNLSMLDPWYSEVHMEEIESGVAVVVKSESAWNMVY